MPTALCRYIYLRLFLGILYATAPAGHNAVVSKHDNKTVEYEKLDATK